MKIGVCNMSIGDDYKRWTKNSRLNKIEYCKKHNYEFIEDDSCYDDSKYTWPIVMDGYKIDMNPGDIVVYRGCDLEHSRDEFIPPGDDWHLQAFLHYVDSNGPYSEYKFDKRDSVGTLLKNNKVNDPYKKYIKYV